MRLFIPGGSGFIGRNFLANFASEFSEILVPVRGDAPQGSGHTSFKSYGGNVDMICSMLRDFTPDVVINCAAAGIQPGERGRDVLANANIRLPGRLYESAKDSDVSAFIHLGSMAEYAAQDTAKKLVETDAVTYDNIYGVSKVAATTMLATLAEDFGPAVTSLRIFGVFGPGESPHRLTSHLASKLRSGETIALSAGTQIRDFIYIRDVVDAIQSAVNFALTRDGGHEIINIGSGVGISVHDFVYAFCKAGGLPVDKLDFGALPMRDTDVPFLVANIEKAANLLDWQPQWNGDAGLKDFFRS